MIYREVPKNGDKLSALGYGLMRLPTKLGRINEPLAEKQILEAIEKGINYFDTAVPYHSGKSESFFGKVLAKNNCRDKVKIADKLPHWQCASKEEMHKVLDEQLAKLQTEYIDYYLIHALNGEMWDKAKDHGVIEFINEALESGKIINAGFSFHGLAEDFNRIVDDYPWSFCQIQYNFLDTENQAGTAGLKYATSKDMAVIIMEPLRGGNLAKTPPPSVRKIWAKADHKRTPAEWSFRWLLNQPEVTVILSGMNDDAHIAENMAIAEKGEANSLTEKEVAIVDEAAAEFRRVMRVGCTGCQYCMPCPAGVDIPGSFTHYNSKHAFKDKQASMFYAFQMGGMVGDPMLASQCIKCGKCVKKCPQSIDIPAELEKVADDMEGWMMKPMIWLGRKMMKVRKKKK
ncbi:aldo/keto reductase [Maridesulfovibrio sp.]|uniref:aldo/keto reductase n=1 Tax=Maridesulfovibrio sp. TaxID=2795000 RepID=UPI003BA9CBE8